MGCTSWQQTVRHCPKQTTLFSGRPSHKTHAFLGAIFVLTAFIDLRSYFLLGSYCFKSSADPAVLPQAPTIFDGHQQWVASHRGEDLRPLLRNLRFVRQNRTVFKSTIFLGTLENHERWLYVVVLYWILEPIPASILPSGSFHVTDFRSSPGFSHVPAGR